MTRLGKGQMGSALMGSLQVFMSFDRGTFWVLSSTYFYLPKSSRACLFPQSVEIRYFCSGPTSVMYYYINLYYDIYVYIYIYIYISLCVYLYLSLSLYIYICIYIHTLVSTPFVRNQCSPAPEKAFAILHKSPQDFSENMI